MANKKDYKVDSDKWYDWRGVKRPERVPNMTEEEMADMFSKNLKEHICEWEQKGNAIECHSGQYVHGQTIGVNKRLAGSYPDGRPLLVPIGPIYRDQV